MTCTRCEDRYDRERPATYIGGGWCLCDDCCDAVAEQQAEDRFTDYWSADTPQTLREQYDAAVRDRHELRRKD